MARELFAAAVIRPIREAQTVMPQLVVKIKDTESADKPHRLSCARIRIIPVAADNFYYAKGYEQADCY